MIAGAAADAPAGAILAGGRARRLGGAVKPLLEVGGVRILDRIRSALAPLVAEIVVVGAREDLGDIDLRVVPDLRPGLGPLAGLEAALASTARTTFLVVAGDMPFLDTGALARLLAADPAADAVCFATARGADPLCARYARRILPRVSAHLDEGRLALQDLLVELGAVLLAPQSETERRSLTNINTVDDLAEASRA
jgi:molybdenum cofactor guanylyltransferase